MRSPGPTAPSEVIGSRPMPERIRLPPRLCPSRSILIGAMRARSDRTVESASTMPAPAPSEIALAGGKDRAFSAVPKMFAAQFSLSPSVQMWTYLSQGLLSQMVVAPGQAT